MTNLINLYYPDENSFIGTIPTDATSGTYIEATNSSTSTSGAFLLNPEVPNNPVVNDRLINLVNYLPQNYAGTQVEEFMKFFQDFLNLKLFKQSYDGSYDEQNVSMLKKIELLFTLRDPDLIDYKTLQLFASYLGYEINYNKTDATNIIGGDAYVNEYLRATIRSLPHWYKLKTTQSAVSMIMYMFGLVSDVFTLWTNDYNTKWRAEAPPFETDQSNTPMLADYYPTPHFKISINSEKSVKDFETKLSEIISLVDSIKPINTVFQGFDIANLYAFSVNINTITTYNTQYTITETITPS